MFVIKWQWYACSSFILPYANRENLIKLLSALGKSFDKNSNVMIVILAQPALAEGQQPLAYESAFAPMLG